MLHCHVVKKHKEARAALLPVSKSSNGLLEDSWIIFLTLDYFIIFHPASFM